ncbi:hypothetical protein [Fervidibacillus albus]|uniref:Endolytic transglycosylase MltG n=1 Tax=Fervidibacillus albus TaxID=2980026 RepID=A0A9E8RV84_9BACI|nr:hypothetical protein [Fervidibacillus albus]WAA10410.1 hypothetical protein OE104_03510 [Fervidibacillus albus]
MDRKTIQAFSFGMLSISVAIFLFFLFVQEDDWVQATKTIDEHGYTYIETESLKNLEEQLSTLKKENDELKTVLAEQKDESGEKEAALQLVEIEIEPGMILDTIAQLLEQNGIIDKKSEFVNFVEQSGKQAEIQTGRFYLHEKMTFDDIMNMITK